MGGRGSGRSGLIPQKKQRVESCRRLDAVTHGAGVVQQQMPEGGGVREFGTCPQCRRAVRFLYQPKGKSSACRACLGLTYASTQASGTAAGELLKNPALLSEAFEQAGRWVEGFERGQAEVKDLNEAMRIIEAGGSVGMVPQDEPARDETGKAPLSSETFENLRVSPDASLQERVIAQDVVRSTRLIEKVESLLAGGVENHVNRLGDVQVVPLRVDSWAKLAHLWVALANLRAARSGVATSIHEQRQGEGEKSLATMLDEAMMRNNWCDRDGYSIEELKAAAEGRALPEPDDEQK
jgi:hypothetical protein